MAPNDVFKMFKKAMPGKKGKKLAKKAKKFAKCKAKYASEWAEDLAAACAWRWKKL